MKKGITIQPFLFIMALVVMAFVIIFGIKSVNDVRETADLTELAIFYKDLENKINVYSQFDIGSSGSVSFGLPSHIERICFANPNMAPTTPIPDELFKSVIETNTKNTVYILPLDAYAQSSFAITRLYVDPREHPLCIPTRGQLTVELETAAINNGVFVQVKRPS